MSIARVSPTITTTTTDDDDAMAPTDVARVIPSRTSPDPAKLVKWTDKPTGCLSIAAWVAVAAGGLVAVRPFPACNTVALVASYARLAHRHHW